METREFFTVDPRPKLPMSPPPNFLDVMGYLCMVAMATMAFVTCVMQGRDALTLVTMGAVMCTAWSVPALYVAWDARQYRKQVAKEQASTYRALASYYSNARLQVEHRPEQYTTEWVEREAVHTESWIYNARYDTDRAYKALHEHVFYRVLVLWLGWMQASRIEQAPRPPVLYHSNPAYADADELLKHIKPAITA